MLTTPLGDIEIYIDDKKVEYTEKNIGALDKFCKKKYRIDENSLPTKVILGRLEVVGKHKIEKLSIEKIKTIFEDGKFLGSRVRDEIEEEY